MTEKEKDKVSHESEGQQGQNGSANPSAWTAQGKEGPAPDEGQAPAAGQKAEGGEAAAVPMVEDQQAELFRQLEEARAEAAEYSAGWQRERADFSNYRKRVERDQAQLGDGIRAGVFKRFLELADDLERALKNRPPMEGEVAQWADGVEMIYHKLQTILESNGVTEVPAKEHDAFDPYIHEALSHDESPDHASGEIIEVVQKGYKIGERIIRPALVRVAR
mgnify:FL=1